MRAGVLKSFLLGGALAAAQSGLAPPQIGYFPDAARNLRPLLGISGTFWSGEPVEIGVAAAASSGSASIVMNRRGLQVLDTIGRPVGRACPAEGPALLAFIPSGAPALAWLSSSGRLLRWSGVQFEYTPVLAAALPGTAVSLAAPDSATAAFLVRNGRQLWRVDASLADGALLRAEQVPGASAPALLLDDGTIVYSAMPSAIVKRNPKGVERIVPFSGSPSQFQLLGKDWILVVSAATPVRSILRLSTGAVFEIPEIPGSGRR